MNIDKDFLTRVDNVLRQVSRGVILPKFQNLKDSDISEKTSPADLVTVADQEAEVFLAEALADILPEAAIVGEEATFAAPETLQYLEKPGPVWVIDPIDGTGNFSRGYDAFGVIIALVIDGVTQAGWIHDPLKEVSLFGAKGQGIFRAVSDGAAFPVDNFEEPGDAPALAELRVSLNHPGLRAMAREMPGHRAIGSAAHIYKRIVEGQMDACLFSRSAPWDHAAGLLLTDLTGGKVGLLVDGSAYRPGVGSMETPLLAARSTQIWNMLQQRVMEALAEG